MARVVVGKCKACGKDLRVKEGAVRPNMRLTCKCGEMNEVGEALADMEPAERIHVLLEGLQGNTDRISSALCPGEIERIVKHGKADDLEELRKNIQPLSVLLASDATPGRETIMDCLGRLGDEDATRGLIGLAKSDPSSGVRRAAVRSLGNLFYQNYIHPFLAHAVESELEVIRLPPGFAGYTLPGRDAYEEYEKAHNIIFVEFKRGDEAIVTCIGEVAATDSDEDVRRCAVQTLRGLKHEHGRTFLERATRDSNVATCEIAEDALSELNQAMGTFELQSCSRPRGKGDAPRWKFWK